MHGDDFSTLDPDWSLDLYEKGMQDAFEVELRDRVGFGKRDIHEVNLLNGSLKVTEQSLTYEADPRHIELLQSPRARDLRFHECPGVKTCEGKLIADGNLLHEKEHAADVQEFQHSLVVPPARTFKVKFDDRPEAIRVKQYAEVLGYHPRGVILAGPIGQSTLVPVDSCRLSRWSAACADKLPLGDLR